MDGRRSSARIKNLLLAEGLRISPAVQTALKGRAKPPTRVRSGSCGGLDLILPDDVHCNAPTEEWFAKESPYCLGTTGGKWYLEGRSLAETVPVTLVPSPAYYAAPRSRSVQPRAIGQLCFDRLGIGLSNRCVFWNRKHTGCQFCSIGDNVGTEEHDKELDEILEVARLAFTDPASPAAHLLLGGGTPSTPDAGALRMADVARKVKERWSQSIYAMLAAPDDPAFVDVLWEAGVDEIGMNLELFDDFAADRFMQLKHQRKPRALYERALRRAVDRFGPVHTRSILIVGLETVEATLDGVRWLCERGVMPILSPFRPLRGTPLEHHERVEGARTGGDLTAIAERAQGIADRYGLPLGPTCIPCQGNTLNVADHALYRHYGDCRHGDRAVPA